MIEGAERRGLLNKDWISIIVEPTSGNQGIALTCICAVRGHKVRIVLPESASLERRKVLRACGAELVLTPVGNNIKETARVSWLLSLVTFFDSSFHIIAEGTVLGSLLKKVNASKEKFAFVLSVTSLQLVVLVPVATAYLGYMTGLVGANMRSRSLPGSPYAVFLRSIPWNLLSWAMLVIALGVTLAGLGFGRLKIGYVRENEGLTSAHVRKEEEKSQGAEEYPRNIWNLVVPILLLLSTMLFFLWLTGRKEYW